ncbi:glycosyltransferase family 2 protein [Ruegeria arenilitoris]|nr:glycosyltransferase family A protein [Ruegeria arenilitoris]
MALKTEFQPENQDLAVAAGVESDDSMKIEYLNRILASSMLSPLSKADPSKALSLSNITSCSPHCKIPDIGRFSIIFPVYNAEETIETAVRSILNQSYSNLEVILCDDFSTDGTLEVLLRLSKDDPRIKIIQNKRNMGAYKTRNEGFRASVGQFILVHDSDDWSHPQRVEMHAAAFYRNPSLVACGSDWVRVTPDFEVTSWRLDAYPIRLSYPSFTVRREVINEIGEWDEVRVSGDAEFIYRVEKFYGKTAVEWIAKDVPLAISLSTDSSLTGTSETHVGTTRHGLRRYYHEAYKFRWRKELSFDEKERKLALKYAPKAIASRNPGVEPADQIVQVDCRLPEAVGNLLNFVTSKSERAVVMHVPEVVYKLPAGDTFCDEFFNAVDELNLAVVHKRECVENAETWRVFSNGDRLKIPSQRV